MNNNHFIPSRFVFFSSPEGAKKKTEDMPTSPLERDIAKDAIQRKVDTLKADVLAGNVDAVGNAVKETIKAVNTIAETAYPKLTPAHKEDVRKARESAEANLNANWSDLSKIAKFVKEEGKYKTRLVKTSELAANMKAETDIDLSIANIKALRDASSELQKQTSAIAKLDVDIKMDVKSDLANRRTELETKYKKQVEDFNKLADEIQGRVTKEIERSVEDGIQDSPHVKKLANAIAVDKKGYEGMDKDILGIDLVIEWIKSQIAKYSSLSEVAENLNKQITGLESLKIEALRLLPNSVQKRELMTQYIDFEDALAKSMLDRMDTSDPKLPPYSDYSRLYANVKKLEGTRAELKKDSVLADLESHLDDKIVKQRAILDMYRRLYEANLSPTNKDLVKEARDNLRAKADALETAREKGEKTAEYKKAKGEYDKARKDLDRYYGMGADGIRRMAALVRPSEKPSGTPLLEVASGEKPEESGTPST